MASTVIFTIGEMLLAPTGEAAATRFVSPGLQGRHLGVFFFAISLGLALGPLVGGAFVESNRGEALL